MSDALIENLNVKCLFTALWMVLLSELDSSILCVLLSFRSKLCVAESIKKKNLLIKSQDIQCIIRLLC